MFSVSSPVPNSLRNAWSAAVTGHIINVASLAGEIYAPGLATYCASKFAVVGFTDAARVEHRTTGVRFSLVMPSFVNTELTAGTHSIPGMRKAEPTAIAEAIVGLVVKPRPRVRATRLAGALSASQKYLPRTIAERLNRALGTEAISPTTSMWTPARVTRPRAAQPSPRSPPTVNHQGVQHV